MVLLPLCLPLFDCINIAWLFCIPKDPTISAHKFVLHSDQVSNPGIKLPSLAEGIYQSRFVDLLVGSSGTLGFVSRTPPKCNDKETGRNSSIKLATLLASVWIVWMVLAANPWGPKKAAKSLGPWVIFGMPSMWSTFAGADDQHVSSLWFVVTVKNKHHQIIHPLVSLVVCSQDHVLYCVSRLRFLKLRFLDLPEGGRAYQ